MTRDAPEPDRLSLPGQSGIKERRTGTAPRLTAPWCVTSPYGHSYDGRTTPRTALDQAWSTRWHGGAMVEGSMTQGAGLGAPARTPAAVPPGSAYGTSAAPGPPPGGANPPAPNPYGGMPHGTVPHGRVPRDPAQPAPP